MPCIIYNLLTCVIRFVYTYTCTSWPLFTSTTLIRLPFTRTVVLAVLYVYMYYSAHSPVFTHYYQCCPAPSPMFTRFGACCPDWRSLFTRPALNYVLPARLDTHPVPIISQISHHSEIGSLRDDLNSKTSLIRYTFA